MKGQGYVPANQMTDTWGLRPRLVAAEKRGNAQGGFFVCVNYCIFITLYSLLLLFGDTITCKSIKQTSEAQIDPLFASQHERASETDRRGQEGRKPMN